MADGPKLLGKPLPHANMFFRQRNALHIPFKPWTSATVLSNDGIGAFDLPPAERSWTVCVQWQAVIQCSHCNFTASRPPACWTTILATPVAPLMPMLCARATPILVISAISPPSE